MKEPEETAAGVNWSTLKVLSLVCGAMVLTGATVWAVAVVIHSQETAFIDRLDETLDKTLKPVKENLSEIEGKVGQVQGTVGSIQTSVTQHTGEPGDDKHLTIREKVLLEDILKKGFTFSPEERRLLENKIERIEAWIDVGKSTRSFMPESDKVAMIRRELEGDFNQRLIQEVIKTYMSDREG